MRVKAVWATFFCFFVIFQCSIVATFAQDDLLQDEQQNNTRAEKGY